LEGQQVEVINFGVSGYGTAQELLALRHKAWRYDPDLVILAFLTGNDLRNNSRALQGGNRPYFMYKGGELVLDRRYTEKRSYRVGTSAVGRLRDWVHLHSRLWQVGVAIRKAWKRRAKPARTPPAGQAERGLDDPVYTEPSEPAWQEAWRITEDLVRQIDAEVRERGARLMVVTLSNSSQVHPDPAERERFARAVGAEDLLYPDRRIQALARAEGIPSLMLVPPLREWAEQHRTCVHGFSNAVPCGGHWNEHGHRVSGEAIAAAVCHELLQPAQPGAVARDPGRSD
jgi:lysophospholipase L1-like esterase